jgi:hypothetical protein
MLLHCDTLTSFEALDTYPWHFTGQYERSIQHVSQKR